MNWEAIGAVGEIVGAVAVVATLAYLAIQMKQNSRSMIGATSQAITRSQNELNVAMMTDPSLATLVDAGMRDYFALDHEQKVRFNNYATAALNVYQDTYVQHVQGAAVEGQWQLSRVILSQYFASESMRKWWTHPKIDARSRLLDAFAGEIDEIMEQVSSDS